MEIRVWTPAVVALGALGACAWLPARRATPLIEPPPLYWSDLGSDSIDVSSYPAVHQANYRVYADVCSRCHTLARSVNSPVVSRAYWEFYLLGMRAVNGFDRNPAIQRDQARAILDFLEYDAKERKIDHRAQFEAQTAELKKRYEPILRERIKRLQESKQPVILRYGRSEGQ